MKKAIALTLIALILIALNTTTFAQDFGEAGRLEYSGKFNFSETPIQGNSNTNDFLGEFWLGQGWFGIRAGYSTSNVLGSSGIFTEKTMMNGGFVLRMVIGKKSEVRVGFLKKFGNSRNMDLFGTSVPGGEELKGFSIPTALVLFQDEVKFCPKFYASVELGFTRAYAFQRQRDPLRVSADLAIYRQDVSDRLFISPTVGYGLDNSNHSIRIGGLVASHLVCQNVLSLGYFNEVNLGTEGFYVSLNVAGLFTRDNGSCLSGKARAW
ncbi:MAG: hypothetical protein PHP37_00390 [Patescibacteria group bacterium]|nr:hypothetical protein [Patescibacteria group bacterium]